MSQETLQLNTAPGRGNLATRYGPDSPIACDLPTVSRHHVADAIQRPRHWRHRTEHTPRRTGEASSRLPTHAGYKKWSSCSVNTCPISRVWDRASLACFENNNSTYSRLPYPRFHFRSGCPCGKSVHIKHHTNLAQDFPRELTYWASGRSGRPPYPSVQGRITGRSSF